MNVSLWDYYQQAADKTAKRAFERIDQTRDWQALRPQLLREFLESAGLAQLPDYRSADFQDCGIVKGKGFKLQKIAWQILPDCWNSAGIYRPDPMPDECLPAILYVNGHSSNGTYFAQCHAIMWARRGYICMTFDTIEQNDNPGDHHGLYYGKRPDWVSMGYSAAGGELWNSIRALDILEKSPGVDSARIGATGNSGGGAHSYFLAAADERIKAVATSCGVVRQKYLIERQHLLSHCDCMLYHNLYGRDPVEFAALIAPRPLLFCFAIEDYLFSTEQYKELHSGARRIYSRFGCEDNCRLFDYHGPHGYQPESVTFINHWFDKQFKREGLPDLPLAELEIPEQQTSVFNGAPPPNNRLAQLPELLSQTGAVALPQTPADWPAIRSAACAGIRDGLTINFDKSIRMELRRLGEWLKGRATYRKYIASFGDNEIWVETLQRDQPAGRVFIAVAGAEENARNVLMRLSEISGDTIAVIVPRFCGFNACISQSDLLLRAGAYMGMTHFMLMLEDLQLIMPDVMQLPETTGRQSFIYGKGDAGIVALYHAALDEQISGIIMDSPTESHRQGAYFINILKHMDIKHAQGLAAPRRIGFVNSKPSAWARRLYARLDCPQNIIEGASLKEIMELL